MKVIKIYKYFLLRDPHIQPTVLNLRQLIVESEDKIALDFSDLADIREGDLMVLSAQLEKAILNYGKHFFRIGKLPRETRIRSLFKKVDKIIHEKQTLPVSNLSDAEKEKLINPRLIDLLVKELKRISIKDYYYPFNTFLTELIGNAVEHGIENKNINWWLTRDIDSKQRQITYTFVDMGIGIVDSHKKAGVPLKYRLFGNKRIVLDALYGKLGSSTKELNRGRGLPQLRDMIENGFVSDLVLITNNVTLRFKDGVFKTSKNKNFVGTYYSWTINFDNYQKWQNTK